MITKPFLNLCADYEDLKGRPFFPGLIKYMASGPVVGMVWQGLDAVKTGRAMLGATNPLNSQPGVSYILLLPPLVCVKRYLTPHAKTKQVLSVVILHLPRAATSATVLTRSRTLRKRLNCQSCFRFGRAVCVMLMSYYVQLVPRGRRSI